MRPLCTRRKRRDAVTAPMVVPAIVASSNRAASFANCGSAASKRSDVSDVMNATQTSSLRDGRYVHLSAFRPVHFDEICPRRDPVVAAKSVANPRRSSREESTLLAQGRVLPISANQPSKRNPLAFHFDGIRSDTP